MLSDNELSPTSVGTDDFTTTESESEVTDNFPDDIIGDINADSKIVVIEQYAQKVLDYSSQYGSGFSISYTAFNITGRPSKFPDYGDFPETFAMVVVYLFP